MRLIDERSHQFDMHRKDHKGRAIMLVLALLASSAVWILIIAALTRVF
ncbi:hypothetical protein [Brevundimonas sp. LM2]|nr:hypothetical protein [Brevundimonas sp. LM2]